jgi:hypothetical protein
VALVGCAAVMKSGRYVHPLWSQQQQQKLIQVAPALLIAIGPVTSSCDFFGAGVCVHGVNPRPWRQSSRCA